MVLAGYLAHVVAGEIFGWRRKRDSAELLSEIVPWRAQRDYDGESHRSGGSSKSSRTHWQRHKKLAYASGEKPAVPVVKTALRTG